jgi:DNA-binding NarL/FixJ family response regulator
LTDAPVKVLIADADVPVRRGIRLLLERNGFRVSSEVADLESALEHTARDRPELCLIDAELPGGGPLAVRRIKSRHPEATVVVLAAKADEADLVEALRAGASGYLPKSIDPAGLARALHAVLRGEPAFPRALLGPVIEAFRTRERGRRLQLPGRVAVELTQRESEVLELLRQNLSTGDIADRLDISPVTVRRHIGSALGKLHVRDRAEAMRLLERAER